MTKSVPVLSETVRQTLRRLDSLPDNVDVRELRELSQRRLVEIHAWLTTAPSKEARDRMVHAVLQDHAKAFRLSRKWEATR